MKCPKCGHEMKEELKRVPPRRAFEGLIEYKSSRAHGKKRPVWHCNNCKKHFIRTVSLVEVEIDGN